MNDVTFYNYDIQYYDLGKQQEFIEWCHNPISTKDKSNYTNWFTS